MWNRDEEKDEEPDRNLPEKDVPGRDGETEGPETGPIPERESDKEPHPSKGAGSSREGENVQQPPEKERNTTNPEHL